MESFLVSARKYRPLDFQDVVGQEAITTTLTNAIANNHLSQAMLFCGPRGVGKTTCARILAKKINEDAGNITKEDYAFNIFELDAASNNSVDDIRNLIDQVRVPPRVGSYKVYIIDEVHMLSQAAYNAFLKTLEEPPQHAIFILATTEKQKIIPTILSRCQIFEFKRITISDIKNHLKYVADNQNIKTEESALYVIAKKADGALRDALSLFDRMVSFCDNNLTTKSVTKNLNILDQETYLQITADILECNIPKLLVKYNDILASGFDGYFFVSGLATHFRNLMLCQNTITIDIMEIEEGIKNKYADQSQKMTSEFLIKCLEITTKCELQYKNICNQQRLVELCLMTLASLDEAIKKKSNGYIIPASLIPKQVKTVEKTPQDQTKNTSDTTYVQPKSDPPPPSDKSSNKKGISALSISSIKYKKSSKINKTTEENVKKHAPQEKFTNDTLQQSWQDFKAIIEKKGNQRITSVLNISKINCNSNNTIWIILPTVSSKDEFLQVQEELLKYLEEDLQNYHLNLEITIGQSTRENYVFTPQEKYEKLKTKNPKIEKLRKRFNLDFN